MGSCLTRNLEKKDEYEEREARFSRNSESLVTYKTTKKAMAKFYLKFPKVNKAYKHLFKGWCEAIGKSVSEGASASEIFNLEGPLVKACDALSRAGILVTNDEILQALSQEVSSPGGNIENLRFKDLIIAVGGIIKAGGDGLKQSENQEKFDEIMSGFKIIQDMFSQIDVDGSGEISLDEFTSGFGDLSFGDDFSIQEKRMAELDFNKDEEISYPEFCVGMSVWVGFVEEFE